LRSATLRLVSIGEADRGIRLGVFDWLTNRRGELGEALPRSLLEGYQVEGRRVPLLGPSGIWKPAVCELPISCTTICGGTYPDEMDELKGVVRYSYRGTDPAHRDNVGLRRVMRERVPLVYFYCLTPGLYAAGYPAFVVADLPDKLTFLLQVDDVGSLSGNQVASPGTSEDPEPRRAYVTASLRRRLHQVAFRERVMRAYQDRCALCQLRHRQLLDAAHITPDSDPEGEPIVSNGLALCKLHHAAFDSFFFTVRPDYVIQVRDSILRETDGPMLVVGLQQIHGQSIHLPSRSADLPDPNRLERRFAEFLQAAS
jgi:putative restriction endonuclease